MALLLLSLLSLASTQCSNYTNSACSFLFSASNCSFLLCVTVPITSRINPPPTNISNQWQICTTQCCSSYTAPTSIENAQSLALYCAQDSVQKLPIAVSVAVAIGLIIFVFLVISLCIYYNCIQCLCPCLRGVERSSNDLALQPPSQIEILQSSKRKPEEVLVTEELFEQRTNQNHCSICLSMETNLTTKCGHHFHVECLIVWTNKRKTCPECRAALIDDFLLYCTQCLKNYQRTSQLKAEPYLCKYCKI